MMEFNVIARRDNELGSTAICKQASITLDTALKGRADAFNPAELLLTALSACIIKGIERVSPMLGFSYRRLEVHVHGVRQDAPPKMEAIRYEIMIDTDETDQRLELLHDNIRKYGTVYNTIVPGTKLSGSVVRKDKACV
ncbi:MAG: OsmC family protein [Mariprofundaceae bacterium]|nr:OsmC family protein [Mariprofundaceae bacterium]